MEWNSKKHKLILLKRESDILMLKKKNKLKGDLGIIEEHTEDMLKYFLKYEFYYKVKLDVINDYDLINEYIDDYLKDKKSEDNLIIKNKIFELIKTK